VLLATGILAGAAATSLRPAVALAQTGIQVIAAPAPEYEFGQTITFTLSAQSTTRITSAALLLDTGGTAPTAWRDVRFQPGARIDAVATFNLATNPLPPFSPIRFWWLIADSAGGHLTTEPATFIYEDNRFTWKTLAQGSVTVHWYQGDQSFGQAAVNIATSALPFINRDVRAPLPERVDIYIYGGAADVQAALQRVGHTWADGHADPKLGVVVVAVAPDLRADYNLQVIIPHEMTHVLIYRATGDSYVHVPYWLNEGLAVMHQGQRDSDFPALLAAAQDARHFLSLSSLCGPFDPTTVRLAYAESESVVRFAERQFGTEGINRLLAAYAGGASCEAGVQSSLGLSLDQLQARWLDDLAPAESIQQRGQALAPWLVLAGLVLLAPVTFLLLAFRGRRGIKEPGKGRMV
jgi:hypothetical protein